MADLFQISPQLKKAELIEQYQKLLDAYNAQVKELKVAQKQLSEADKHRDEAALKVAEATTVQGVVDALGRLRGQFGKALTDLTEQMTTKAEQVDALTHTIARHEARLKELHDIEVAADTLARLMEAYEERSTAAEGEFARRLAEMESGYAEKQAALEAQLGARKTSLEAEIADTRAAWGTERTAQKTAQDREEAEYAYTRDRKRRLDADAYEEKKAAQEKTLAEARMAAEAALKDREAAVAAAEAELKDLRKQVAEFPKTLERETTAAAKQADATARGELEHAAALAAKEHEWSQRILEARAAHLEESIADRDTKIGELKKDLDRTTSQVQQIAAKAIDGSSVRQAYQSVNEIALEQARRPQKSKDD